MGFRNRNKTCCAPGPIAWLKTLSFSDGSKASVIGLDAIFEDLYGEDAGPSPETASEIVRRLSRKNNIPFSLVGLYEDAVLEEFTSFMECRTCAGAPEDSQVTSPVRPRKGLLSRFMGWLK